jgi:hypothetical protein
MKVFPQVGDVGLPIVLVVTEQGVPVDISPATDLSIVLRAPDGRHKTFNATFKTNGEDGKVQYVTADAEDLDVDGLWEVQAKLTLGSFSGYTAVANMPVRKNADR